MPYASGQAESLYMGLEASYKTLPGTAVADKLSVISPAGQGTTRNVVQDGEEGVDLRHIFAF